MTKILKWDSEFFGFNIADFDPREWMKNPLGIDSFVAKNKIRLLQCCVDIRQDRIINWLEYNSFRLIDLKMTYSAQIPSSDRKRFRGIPATHADVPALKRIARTCFKDSRFYDSPFDRNQGDRLVETWVEKSVLGTFDDLCLKIEKNNEPVGFVTARFKSCPARIGLVGLRRGYRSQGLGRELLCTLFNHLASHNIKQIRVVTQGRNIGAQNFYSRNGFRLINVSAWFYRIF